MIVNYFSHCHFKAPVTQQPEPPTQDTEEDLPLTVLISHLGSVGFEVNGAATDFITAYDQLVTSEAITDDIILHTVEDPCTDRPVCADEDDEPPPKPPHTTSG